MASAASRRAGLFAALALAAACACLLAGCGGATRYKTLNAGTLEPLVTVERYPVFWLGGRFRGLPLTEVSADPSGAYEVQYGACTSGGPETCISPVAVVSEPDNSFLPGADASSSAASIRGVRAVLAQDGKVIEIPTGPVVVDIRAASSALALAAARQMVPINELGSPEGRLPAAQPNTGFADRPTEAQRPQTVEGMPTGRPRGQ